MASVTDYTGGEVFPTGSFPWRALKQIFLLGCLGRSYLPECVEDEFYELRLLGILGSSLPVRHQCLKIRNLRDALLYLMGIGYIRVMDR